jgi:integrase
MEWRRIAEEDPKQLKALRRGWCLGGEGFGQDLLAQMQGRVGENHYGEERAQSEAGRRGLTPGVLCHVVHDYVKASGIAKNGSCHLFRHAMATLMLENGADLRYVQQMLGHARLSATEIYTHVNIQKLIEVHRLTHQAKLPETKPVATCQPAGKSDIILA